MLLLLFLEIFYPT